MELTEFGRFIRKFRIDRSIRLKDMADAVNVSPSFLSGIEVGKKVLPFDLEKKIATHYQMSHEEVREMQEAADASRTQVYLDLPSNNNLDKQVIGAFCRNISNLDDEKKKAILDLLNKKGEL